MSKSTIKSINGGTEINVETGGITIKADKINLETESQLDRIEKKMDSILELLEGKELSISLDGKKLASILDANLGSGAKILKDSEKIISNCN